MADDHAYALGMRRGGAVWWDKGDAYVAILKHDGPVLMIPLADACATPEHPDLARIVKTATVAEAADVTYRQAHDVMTEKETGVEGWWGSIAKALLALGKQEGS